MKKLGIILTLALTIAVGTSTAKAEGLETLAFSSEKAKNYVYKNRVNASDSYTKGNRGLIVSGKAPTARAMEPFGWSADRAARYAAIANKYYKELGGTVNVYCMPIPLQIAFYCPDAAKGITADQHKCIQKMFEYLNPGVKGVDIYPILGEHANEHIYSRTDHHWQALGAYYADAQLAHEAGVPFKPLTEYEKKVIPGFIGTMPSCR